MRYFSYGSNGKNNTNMKKKKTNSSTNLKKRYDGYIGSGLYSIYCGIMKNNDEEKFKKLEELANLIPSEIKTDIRENTNINMASKTTTPYNIFKQNRIYKNGNGKQLVLKNLLLKISKDKIQLSDKSNLSRLIRETISKIIVKEIPRDEIESFNRFMNNKIQVRELAISNIKKFKKLMLEDTRPSGVISETLQKELKKKSEKKTMMSRFGWTANSKSNSVMEKFNVDNIKNLLNDFSDFVTHTEKYMKNTFTGRSKSTDIKSLNTQLRHWKPFINLELNSNTVRRYMYSKYMKNNKNSTYTSLLILNNDQMKKFHELYIQTSESHPKCVHHGLNERERVRMHYFFDNFSKNKNTKNLKDLYSDLRKLHKGTNRQKVLIYKIVSQLLNFGEYEQKQIVFKNILYGGEREQLQHETNHGIGYKINNLNNEEYKRLSEMEVKQFFRVNPQRS